MDFEIAAGFEIAAAFESVMKEETEEAYTIDIKTTMWKRPNGSATVCVKVRLRLLLQRRLQ